MATEYLLPHETEYFLENQKWYQPFGYKIYTHFYDDNYYGYRGAFGCPSACILFLIGICSSILFPPLSVPSFSFGVMYTLSNNPYEALWARRCCIGLISNLFVYVIGGILYMLL